MAALLLFNALAAMLLAAVLLRAKRCPENQMLAIALLLDAAAVVHLGWLVADGESITSPESLRTMLVGKMLVVYPLLEFAYAFPFGRSVPRSVRLIGPTATAAGIALVLHPRTAASADTWVGRLLFFLPFAVTTLRVMFANLREIKAHVGYESRGAYAVLIALCYRWVTELVLFVAVRPLWPELFPSVLLIHGSISVLGSYVVIVHAVLVYHCLRVGGLIARTALHGILLVACVAIVVATEEFIAAHVSDPFVRSLVFGALAVLLWCAWILAKRFGPALESAVLSPLDPRRHERKSVLERTLRDSAHMAHAGEICALTSTAIAILNGGRASFCRARGVDDPSALSPGGASLPAALESALYESEGAPITREQSFRLPTAGREAYAALGADVLLPVQTQEKVLGAMALYDISKLDPEMLETSKVLADNLAAKLAHHALYERAFELQTQLEASRQLTALGSFAAAIAHDIRTPLTSVKMNLEMLRDRVGSDEESRECAALALEELGRMNDYVSGILDYVKPVQLRAVDCDLRDLVQDTARVMQPLLESRKLQLVCDVPEPETLASLHVDALRMRQILVNLVSNAADASSPGALIRITARACREQHAAIAVCDHGEGIAAPDLTRIFEPFFTTRTEGTGLGLAIVKKLVVAHGGAIDVESTLGVGSTFTVKLPMAEARAPHRRLDDPQLSVQGIAAT